MSSIAKVSPLKSLAVACAILFLGICANGAVTTNDQPSPLKLTVTGHVFRDSNSNGKLDAGEPGLAGVPVSDGLNVVKSDRSGSFKIAGIDRQASRFVFVVSPSGYRSTNSFYRALSKDKDELVADFAFAPSPKSANPNFTFAQITDIHVQGEPDTLLADLKEIAAFKPAFVFATGDLVNDGKSKEQFVNYKEAVDRSPVPVLSGVGNHDVGGGSENFEELFGPTYYSFDYGGCHFIALNCVSGVDRQYEWLKNDLAAQPAEKEIIVCQHYQPDDRLMEFFAKHETLAVFSGHWHSTKVFPYGDKSPIMYVNTPSLRFGGIDASPRGYVLVSLRDGKLGLEHRLLGLKRHLSLVAPANGADLPQGRLDIRVAAYDAGSPDTKVEYQIDSGLWKKMSPAGEMSWQAQEDKLKAGSHTICVKADFGGGAVVENQAKFTLSQGKAVSPLPGLDWPMFHRDSARTGATSDAVKPPLQLAWSMPLRGVTHVSSPVVVGGRVYIGVADENVTGRAGVYALDARSGEIIWHHKTRASVKHTVAVSGDLVYAATVDGMVYALDANTGDERWHFSLGSGLARWIFSAPVVQDGTVYAGVGSSFAALDAATGDDIWAADEMGGDWISCLTSPAVGGNSVFMGVNWSNGLFAIDKRTGKQVWNDKKGFGTSHSTPSFSEDMVYHAADGKLHAVEADSGEEKWGFDLPGGWAISSPAVSGGKVVVGGADGVIYSVDASTGKEAWHYQTGSPLLFFTPYSRDGGPIVSSPAIAGGFVYCGGVDGKLYALDFENGNVLWSYDLGVPITSSPAVSGNAVYVSTYDGTVFAFTQPGGSR